MLSKKYKTSLVRLWRDKERGECWENTREVQLYMQHEAKCFF